MKQYRLKKSLGIFRHVLRLYRRKRQNLSAPQKQEIVDTLNHLQEEVMNKDRTQAHLHASNAESFCSVHFKKTPFERLRDFIVALGCALLVAVAIRTVWFELYEIPTGSMRPTFKEQDRLMVSKTAFGINIPLSRGHFYFNPELVLRNGIVIFTGAGMDISDVNTLYFYLFPGKKQYIKRLIGKPGDILYFYGGQIYGIDKEGHDISSELQLPLLNQIDHVPYIHLNGKVLEPSQAQGGIYTPVTLKQMNQPVAKLSLTAFNKPKGELLPPYNQGIHDYHDLWGFKNYGMSRLLTKKEVLQLHGVPETQLIDAPLYMEITHHPTTRYPRIERDPSGKLRPGVGTTSSLLPLNTTHLKTLLSNLYTARFIVKDGKATRYGFNMKRGGHQYASPSFPDVPDGTYEFYYGKGYQVLFSGLTKELPDDHPLYQYTPERVQLLYNLGIEFQTYFMPTAKDQYFMPSRYVYYRNGDLYAMGAPLMNKDDATLIEFVEKEYLRQENAPSYHPHFPFDDNGPPLDSEGKIDVDFIKQYGISVPQKHYLALGDNYAMSADSRDFGFVPESNIRGIPDFIFYPTGKRWGFPLQVDYPFFNSPRFVVWSLALIAFIAWYLYHRKNHKLPINIE